KDVLWGFIRRYAPDATPEALPKLDQLVGYAINYYTDFVKPAKTYRAATDMEATALADLASKLEALGDEPMSAVELQTLVYDIVKAHAFENLRDWFRALYEVLLGEAQGPRFGSFIALYGI